MNKTASEPSPSQLFEEFFGPSIFVPWTDVLLGWFSSGRQTLRARRPEFAQDDPEERDALIAAIRADTGGVLRRYREGDRLRFPMPNYIATVRA